MAVEEKTFLADPPIPKMLNRVAGYPLCRKFSPAILLARDSPVKPGKGVPKYIHPPTLCMTDGVSWSIGWNAGSACAIETPSVSAWQVDTVLEQRRHVPPAPETANPESENSEKRKRRSVHRTKFEISLSKPTGELQTFLGSSFGPDEQV